MRNLLLGMVMLSISWAVRALGKHHDNIVKIVKRGPWNTA